MRKILYATVPCLTAAALMVACERRSAAPLMMSDTEPAPAEQTELVRDKPTPLMEEPVAPVVADGSVPAMLEDEQHAAVTGGAAAAPDQPQPLETEPPPPKPSRP